MREGPAAQGPVTLVEGHAAVEPCRFAAAVAEDAADTEGSVLDLVLAQPVATVIGPPPGVETHAGKAGWCRKIVGGREHGGDFRIGVADRGLEPPDVAVFGRPAKVDERDLHGGHPTPHGVPHHASTFHRGLPRLVRLSDLGQVAVDLAHAARIADDAIDGAFRAPLIVARIDEDLEDIVRRQRVRRPGGIGAGLPPHGIRHAKQQAELLRVIGDVQIGEIAIARIAHRADLCVHESGKAGRVAEVVLDADGLAGQDRNFVRRAGDRHEWDWIGGYAARQFRQGRDRRGFRRSGKQRCGCWQQTDQQYRAVT